MTANCEYLSVPIKVRKYGPLPSHQWYIQKQTSIHVGGVMDEKMASCMFVAYIFKSCVSFGPLHDGHHLMCVKAKRPFLFMNIYCNNNNYHPALYAFAI